MADGRVAIHGKWNSRRNKDWMDRELCGLLARDRDVGQGWDTLENDVDSYGVT